MTSIRWTEADLVHLPAPVREQIRTHARGENSKSAPRETSVKDRVSKYRNQPAVVDGIRFPSKLEARCYEWHKARAAAGEIAWFTRQVPFTLEGGVVYRADFLAVLAPGAAAPLDWAAVVEVTDAKGRLTSECRNKLKQVYARYGVRVRLWPPR